MRIHITLRYRLTLAVAVVATALGCFVRPAVASGAGEGAFVKWAAAHAVPIAAVDADGDFADLRPLQTAIGSARVVVLGEPAHGAHEPLAMRNRLFHYLVENLGFTAIALESGFPESHRVEDYVAGGPGQAAAVVHGGLTSGFGGFQENVDLVRWMRAYNADASHRR